MKELHYIDQSCLEIHGPLSRHALSHCTSPINFPVLTYSISLSIWFFVRRPCAPAMGWTETVMKALFGGVEGGGYIRLWSKNTSCSASSSTPVDPAAPPLGKLNLDSASSISSCFCLINQETFA
jgi:hypothetical protein